MTSHVEILCAYWRQREMAQDCVEWRTVIFFRQGFPLCLSTYLLTYSIVQIPSWEVNWFAASQEIPRISRNPKVHYHTHKRPPTVPSLGQPNPVHIPTYHLLEIHPNIIHPSTPRSTQWSLSIRFPHQDPIHPRLLTHTRHMPSPLCLSTRVNKEECKLAVYIAETCSWLFLVGKVVFVLWFYILPYLQMDYYSGGAATSVFVTTELFS